MGERRPRGLAVRHRSDDRLDRLRERQGRRLGVAADLVGRRRSSGCRATSARGKLLTGRPSTRALRPAHARATTPSPSRARPTERDQRLARDRQRHDGAGQHRRRRGDQHRRHGSARRTRRRRRSGTARSASQSPVDGGTRVLTTVAVSPSGGDRARPAHGRLRLRAGDAAVRRHRPERRRQRAGQLRVPDRGGLPRRRVRPAATSRSTTPAPTSPSACRRATSRRRSAARSAPSSSTCTSTSPAPAPTSTAASYPLRNYQIAAASAWNRLIEVQGFGQRFEDAAGDTVGSIAISANRISRYITFSVSRPASAARRRPAGGSRSSSTARTGSAADQARGFAPTPQDFQFGVCATGELRPALHSRPGERPQGRCDVLTPPGVSQADELDYTLHSPVVLQGVTLP